MDIQILLWIAILIGIVNIIVIVRCVYNINKAMEIYHDSQIHFIQKVLLIVVEKLVKEIRMRRN